MTGLTASPLSEQRALRGGCTPIWAAAEAGHKEVVFTLMAAGADTNVANKFGRTALIAAALQGNTELVLALISKGADVNMGDEDGETPLYVSAFQDQAEVGPSLFAHTAPVHPRLRCTSQRSKTRPRCGVAGARSIDLQFSVKKSLV